MNETTQRKSIKKGLYVLIECQKTQEEIYGFVQKILSKKDKTSEIRVQLQSGEVGPVIEIPSIDKLKQMNFKFYNLFFHERIYLLRHRKTQEIIVLPLKKPEQIERTVFLTNDPKKVTFEIHPDWYWKAVSKNKNIHLLLEPKQVDIVILNQQKKLTLTQFKTLEYEFKIVMP